MKRQLFATVEAGLSRLTGPYYTLGSFLLIQPLGSFLLIQLEEYVLLVSLMMYSQDLAQISTELSTQA
jgi:hypothetical protein